MEVAPKYKILTKIDDKTINVNEAMEEMLSPYAGGVSIFVG